MADARPRIVYVGRLSRGRGLATVLTLGREFGDAARVEVVGEPVRNRHLMVRGYTELPVRLVPR